MKVQKTMLSNWCNDFCFG